MEEQKLAPMDRQTFINRLRDRFGIDIIPDTELVTHMGTLRINMCPYTGSLREVVYTLPYGMHSWRHVNRKGLPENFTSIWRQLSNLYDDHVVYYLASIRHIEKLIEDLEEIRGCEVEYKRMFDRAVPVAVAHLKGVPDFELFTIFKHGIKYTPSSRSGYDGKGSYTWAADVKDIYALPFTEFTSKSVWRTGSSRMDMFVSKSVRFVPSELDASAPESTRRLTGHILIGDEIVREI